MHSSLTDGQSCNHRPLRVHFIQKQTSQADRLSWGLHVWGASPVQTDWSTPLQPCGSDGNSCFWDITINKEDSAVVGLLVHKGELKAARGELAIPLQQSEVWLVGNEQEAFLSLPVESLIPVGSINKQSAVFVDERTIAWRRPLLVTKASVFRLHYSKDARMRITGLGVQEADESFDLSPLSDHLPSHLALKYPFLEGCSAISIPQEVVDQLNRLVTGQLLISDHSSDGKPLDATGIQLQGLLDATHSYQGPLGYKRSKSSDSGSLTVWAPTAQSVDLIRWEEPRGGIPADALPMARGRKGEWTLDHIPRSWEGSYFKYRIKVYCPWTQKIEVSEATDPYSFSLTADGGRSQFIDLDLNPSHEDADLISRVEPNGWRAHLSPPLAQWTDISVYELSIRDFSAMDPSVPEKLKGKYLAFSPQHVTEKMGRRWEPVTDKNSVPPTSGLQHLARLRAAGLNHLHLLPTYDFGSVPERAEDQLTLPFAELYDQPPSGEGQQAMVAAVADKDAFNWGYDPVHFSTPEGSYSTNPDGTARILEFREMVQSLHSAGWRVVLDVVYNHTFRSGPHDQYSVLDKIVPGYYHRRMEDGDICQSTCCNNTATENLMMERLIIDDMVHWAKRYRIDGFRFDIMGHLLVSTMNKIRSSLDQLTLEADGVDGRSIYIYGEAWDFGEMVENQRGVNASQQNLSGTGLGAFNDRIRDGALGGGPFAPYHTQGLVTGLALTPNQISLSQGSNETMMKELLELTDWVRWSLAGNLRDYRTEAYDGRIISGEEAKAHGLPLAYGSLPHENVSYIGCHDNLTVFDTITEKAPSTLMAEERMRMCAMCHSLVALSQGVPFFHAGDDLLRSKSLDRDSYNSGDWFNRIDWTGHANNFGVGLPPASKNQYGWHYKRSLLSNRMITPTPLQIQTSTAIFQLMLRIRYSSPLFRLARSEDVVRQVSFLNTGVDQQPGVIVMVLTSADALDEVASGWKGVVDPVFKRLIVVFNCSPFIHEQRWSDASGVNRDAASWELHPFQAAFAQDERAGARSTCSVEVAEVVLRVPPRTCSIFTDKRQSYL